MTNEKKTLQYWINQLDEIWLDNVRYIHKGKDIDLIMKYAFLDLLSQDNRLETATASDFKRLVNSWLSNKRPEKQVKKRDISNL